MARFGRWRLGWRGGGRARRWGARRARGPSPFLSGEPAPDGRAATGCDLAGAGGVVGAGEVGSMAGRVLREPRAAAVAIGRVVVVRPRAARPSAAPNRRAHGVVARAERRPRRRRKRLRVRRLGRRRWRRVGRFQRSMRRARIRRRRRGGARGVSQKVVGHDCVSCVGRREAGLVAAAEHDAHAGAPREDDRAASLDATLVDTALSACVQRGDSVHRGEASARRAAWHRR